VPAKSEKFEASYKKLEAILQWFDSEEFDLDQAEAKFDEGIKLVEALSKRLKDASLKVEKLKTKLEET